MTCAEIGRADEIHQQQSSRRGPAGVDAQTCLLINLLRTAWIETQSSPPQSRTSPQQRQQGTSWTAWRLHSHPLQHGTNEGQPTVDVATDQPLLCAATLKFHLAAVHLSGGGS